MKKIIYIAVLITLTGLYLSGCDFGVQDDNTPPEVTDAVITGRIVESVSGDPIFNASVIITDGITRVNTTTGNDGKFSANFTVTEDKELTLIYSKAGYDTDTTRFFVTVSSSVELPVLKLTQQQGSGGTSSGQAASIYLYSQSAKSVGVKESGANETVQMI